MAESDHIHRTFLHTHGFVCLVGPQCAMNDPMSHASTTCNLSLGLNLPVVPLLRPLLLYGTISYPYGAEDT